MNIRDKAIITLLAKTGIRRDEPITPDISDVDFVEQKIRLKPTAKSKQNCILRRRNGLYSAEAAPAQGGHEREG